MRTNRTRVSVSIAALLALGSLMSMGSAQAGPTDPFTEYANDLANDVNFNYTQMTQGGDPNDNITCDPTPTVGGTMVNPRVNYVAGEVFANVAGFGTWKCTSLDTSKTYSINLAIRDMYFDASVGKYVPSQFYDSRPANAIAGQAVTYALITPSYSGGSPALNTWHYIRGWATTSTGRVRKIVSEMFYVAGY